MFGPVGRVLPFRACRPIAHVLGSILWAMGVRRAVALRNLAMAFPELSDRERRRIGRRSACNLLTVYLEMLTLRSMTITSLRRRLRVENLELLDGIDSGALLLSGHYGNWELLAFATAAIANVPFTIVVKEQRDFGQLERMRTARGNRVIPTAQAARRASALLRDGGVVALLADQAAAEHEPVVDLFGLATHVYSAPARLALRYRPRVIVGFARRERDGTYRARLQEIPHDDLPDSVEGIHQLTQRYADVLENAVRECPDQWVWQHRRWKNTPGVTYSS